MSLLQPPLVEGGRGDPIEAASENAGGALRRQTTLPKVLVVDDDKDTRVALAEMLGAEGFDVVAAPDGESLRRLKAIAPQVPVIILAGNGETSAAVQAMKLGAYDYLSKSLQADEILIALRRCIGPRARGAENEGPTNQLGEEGSLRRLMGPSGRVQDIAEQIRQVADSNFVILLQGETGTGKLPTRQAVRRRRTPRHRPGSPSSRSRKRPPPRPRFARSGGPFTLLAGRRAKRPVSSKLITRRSI